MSFDLQISGGDLVISNSDFSTISGTNKLVQDILKIALTPAGATTPWYGSLVSRTLIGSYLKSEIIISVAKTQLQNAITSLQTLQNLQVKSGQTVTPDEQIAFISDINIRRDTADPRNFHVTINVLSRSFGKVTAVFTANNM